MHSGTGEEVSEERKTETAKEREGKRRSSP